MSKFKSIDDILQNIERLPTIPKAVLEIIRCIDDQNAGIDEVVKTISLDIGLAASILKVANSTRYAGQGNIANIHDALMFVGLQQIRTMACIVWVTKSFPQNKSSSFDYVNFWRHSVGVAVCAKTLARIAGLNPEVGFISGMLHDIGQLIFATSVPDDFRMAMDYRASHQCQVSEAELEILGYDHSMMGAHLARKWNIPEVICNAIENHHMPDVIPSHKMSDLIHVSEVLAQALEISHTVHPIPTLSDCAMTRLGISFSQLKPYLSLIECEHYNTMLMLN